MGQFWVDDYRRFVADFADRFEFGELMSPSGSVYESDDFPQFSPHISVAFDPMPEWMEIKGTNISDLHGGPYRSGQGGHQQHVAYRALFHGTLLAYHRAADIYEDHVMDQLDTIVEWATGRILLQEIEDAAVAKHVSAKIRPYHGKDVNAKAFPHLFDLVAATALGRPVLYNNPKERRVGSGRGADAIVEYSPGIFKKPFQEGMRRDEVLYHELVHASREMRGVLDQLPVDAGYSDKEEYLAVVLANIYMSDKWQIAFRASHDDWPAGVVPTGANAVLVGADAWNFLKNVQHVNLKPQDLLENFRNTQPSFYGALTRLPPIHPLFNPVLEYEQARIASNNARHPAAARGGP
jgi:hypothetical protein